MPFRQADHQNVAFSAGLYLVCQNTQAWFSRHKLHRKACLKHHRQAFSPIYVCLPACVQSPGRREANILAITVLLSASEAMSLPTVTNPCLSDRWGHPQARSPPPLAPVVCPLATGHLTHRRKRVELDITRAPDGVSPLESHRGQGSSTRATCNERCRCLAFNQAADQCSNHTVLRVPLLWSPRPCRFVVYTIDGIACWSTIQTLLLAAIGHRRATRCTPWWWCCHLLRDVLLLMQWVKEACRRWLHEGLAGWRLHGLRRCCELMECLRAAGRRMDIINNAVYVEVLLG